MDKMPKWLLLNAEVKRPDGTYDTEKDKAAAKEYFLGHVNKRTVFFHNLQEKIDYLVENNYYEKEFLDKYSFKDIKKIFKIAYSYKFRFPTYMGAFKFYNDYALKTNDNEEYLERYEDRMSIIALYHAAGDVEKAETLVRLLMEQTFTPATPTLLNTGRKRRGEFVSCFTETAMITTKDGYRSIRDIDVNDSVLTHSGEFRNVLAVNKHLSNDNLFEVDVIGLDKFTGTSEHPVLVVKTKNNKSFDLNLEPSVEGFIWIELKNLTDSDQVAGSFIKDSETIYHNVYTNQFIDDSTVFDNMVYKKTKDVKNNKKKGHNLSLRHKPIYNKIALDYDFGLFLGYYLSEGYVHFSEGIMRGLRFTFSSKEVDYIEDVKRIALDKFGVESVININKDNSSNVNPWSSILGEFFIKNFNTGFDKKRLPDWVMRNTSEEFKTGLLIGALRGDGWSTTNKMGLMLTNLSLIEQLHLIANSLGLFTYFHTKETASGKIAGELSFPYAQNTEFIHLVGKDLHKITSSKDGLESRKYIKFINGYRTYKVRKITKIEKNEPVYNLQVDKDQTYIVNGVVVHNCFLLDVGDSLNDISRANEFAMQLAKRGGGVSLNLSNIRARGESVKEIQDISRGVVGVMKLFDNGFRYANQLGQRNGSGATYLSIFHADFEEFLATKKINADDDIRMKTLSIGVTIPDKFIELAKAGEQMYQFYPKNVYDVTGVQFGEMTAAMDDWYEVLAENPLIKKKAVSARKMLELIALTQGESGYPYLMFIDTVNRDNPLDDKVYFSNLC